MWTSVAPLVCIRVFQIPPGELKAGFRYVYCSCRISPLVGSEVLNQRLVALL
jgi:hypothetical protein